MHSILATSSTLSNTHSSGVALWKALFTDLFLLPPLCPQTQIQGEGGEGTVTVPQTHASCRFPHCPQDPPGPGKPMTASKEHCSTQTLDHHTPKVSSPVLPPSEILPYPAPPHQPLSVQLVNVPNLDRCPVLLKALCGLHFRMGSFRSPRMSPWLSSTASHCRSFISFVIRVWQDLLRHAHR